MTPTQTILPGLPDCLQRVSYTKDECLRPLSTIKSSKVNFSYPAVNVLAADQAQRDRRVFHGRIWCMTLERGVVISLYGDK